MSAATARAVLRPSRLVLRQTPVRNASTTSEAANAASQQATKAKEGASQATSKASEGLSKVTASSESAMSKAGPAISNSANRVGGRAGQLISAVQSLIPPTVHYARVASEVSKIVFRGQKMSPPSLAEFQAQLTPVFNALRSPSTLFSQNPGLLSPQQYLNTLRNISGQQLAAGGVIVAEVIGFFTVGEMLGRLKIVGYRSATPHSTNL